MITREQVADLRPGDVVELACANWTPGTTIRGPIWGAGLDESEEDREPFVGPVCLREMGPAVSLTVISRGPRPLHNCPECTHMAPKVGDPWCAADDAPQTGRECAVTDPETGFVCCRCRPHPSPHIAGNGRNVLAVWS